MTVVPGDEVGAEANARGVGDAHAGRHARSRPCAGTGRSCAPRCPARCSDIAKPREVGRMHRAGVGPRDDRQLREDAVEVDGVGRDQQVGEQVQPQVGVRGGCGGRVQVDVDRDEVDAHVAARRRRRSIARSRRGRCAGRCPSAVRRAWGPGTRCRAPFRRRRWWRGRSPRRREKSCPQRSERRIGAVAGAVAYNYRMPHISAIRARPDGSSVDLTRAALRHRVGLGQREGHRGRDRGRARAVAAPRALPRWRCRSSRAPTWVAIAACSIAGHLDTVP